MAAPVNVTVDPTVEAARPAHVPVNAVAPVAEQATDSPSTVVEMGPIGTMTVDTADEIDVLVPSVAMA